MIVLVRLPDWAFQVSLYLCQTRHQYFKNQFKNTKLRGIHEGLDYIEYLEGIIGYYGDIACAIYLGIDPKQMLTTMVYETDGLTKRDRFDLLYKKNNIDVKIEDFSVYQDAVINGFINEKQPYGCRLINVNQWNQNSHNIDYYVFGCFQYAFRENFKLHDARSIFLLGYMPKSVLIDKPISSFSPANKKLNTPAKIIPNHCLYPILHLPNIEIGTRNFDMTYHRNDRINRIISDLNNIWGRNVV